MPWKVVVLFDGRTTGDSPLTAVPSSAALHSFGFSESYLTSSSSFDNELNYLQNSFAPKRAGILPGSTRIIGARFYQVGGGRAIPIKLNFPGTSGVTGIANKAVLCTSNNANAAVARRWWVHNIPDAQCTGGEFTPSVSYGTRFNQYLDTLAAASWSGIVRASLATIVTIDAAGLVTCSAAHSFAVGQFVTISRTLTENGSLFGGLFRVATVGPLSSQFTLVAWDQGACSGGDAFLKQAQAYVIGLSGRPFIERAGTRRVGRPFGLYRGRSSRRTLSS